MAKTKSDNAFMYETDDKQPYDPPRLIPLGDIDEFATAYDVSVHVP